MHIPLTTVVPRIELPGILATRTLSTLKFAGLEGIASTHASAILRGEELLVAPLLRRDHRREALGERLRVVKTVAGAVERDERLERLERVLGGRV